jgi:hypothetical protein
MRREFLAKDVWRQVRSGLAFRLYDQSATGDSLGAHSETVFRWAGRGSSGRRFAPILYVFAG